MRVVATIRNASEAFFRGTATFPGFYDMTDKEKLEFALNPAAQVPEAKVEALVGDGSEEDFEELKRLMAGGFYSVDSAIEIRKDYKLVTFVVAGDIAAATKKQPVKRAARPVAGGHYVPKLTALTGMTEYQLMSLIAQTIRDVDGGPFQAAVYHPHARGVIERLERAMLTFQSTLS